MSPDLSRLGLFPCSAAFFFPLLCALLLTPVSAEAQNHRDSTTIREMRSLDFGTVGRPANSPNTFDLHWQNNAVTVSGAGNGFFAGGATSGRYQIRGLPNRAFTFTAEIVNFSASGIVVEELFVNGPQSSVSGVLNGGGIYQLRIGGRVVISPDATPGYHETDVLMIIHYE